jgi:membrane-associated HD superfamily phosphohydrolase
MSNDCTKFVRLVCTIQVKDYVPHSFNKVKKNQKKNRMNSLALLQLRSELNLHGTIISLCKWFKTLFFTWESSYVIEKKKNQNPTFFFLLLTIVSLTVFWFDVDYCFTDCILVQCWLLFHWLYFGSMLTIVSLTAFWFNVDYCFIDCILAQWWLLFHWLTLNQNTVNEIIVNIEPTYS